MTKVIKIAPQSSTSNVETAGSQFTRQRLLISSDKIGHGGNIYYLLVTSISRNE